MIIALGLCGCNSPLVATCVSPLLTTVVLTDVTGQEVPSDFFKSQYVSFWKMDHCPVRGRRVFSQEKRSTAISRPSQPSEGSCNILVRSRIPV